MEKLYLYAGPCRLRLKAFQDALLARVYLGKYRCLNLQGSLQN